MNAKTGDPQRVRAEIELLESFFKRFGKEFKDSLSQVKLSVEEFGWADWYHYDLGTARTNELISIPDEGDCICRVKLDGSATIKLNNPQAQSISLETIPRIYGIPFKRLYLTNTAQSGKELLLLIGRGNFSVEVTTMAGIDLQAQYTALIDSTTTPLSASGTYTTPSWFDAANYGFVSVMSSSDVAGTLYLQWSNDGTNLHYEEKVEATPLTLSDTTTVYYAIIKSDKPARYCRVHYVNSSSDQTKFSLYAYARVIR